MKTREFRYQVSLNLPNKERQSFELSVQDTTSTSARYNAKQLVMREERLTDEQEQYIKLEEVRE